MEYNIIAQNDPHHMAKLVNEMCANGWTPCGSPMVAATDGQSWYHYQAMIRKTPNTAEDSQKSGQQTHEAIALWVELSDHLDKNRNINNWLQSNGARINAVVAQQHHA